MRALVVIVLALAAAAPAAASENAPTQAELEAEIVCPVCTPATLDQSNAPAAQQMKRFIARRIAAGDTKSEIKRKLVANYGRRVLATPPKEGFDLLAWALPIGGVAAGALVAALLAWRWSRARDDGVAGPVGVDPELDRRVDQELARFET